MQGSLHRAPGSRMPVSADRSRRRINKAHGRMVLKVATNLWTVGNHRNPETVQGVCVADSRQHEKLRRVHSAPAQDHLSCCVGSPALTALDIFNAYGNSRPDDDTSYKRMGMKRQVAASKGRDEVSRGRA